MSVLECQYLLLDMQAIWIMQQLRQQHIDGLCINRNAIVKTWYPYPYPIVETWWADFVITNWEGRQAKRDTKIPMQFIRHQPLINKEVLKSPAVLYFDIDILPEIFKKPLREENYWLSNDFLTLQTVGLKIKPKRQCQNLFRLDNGEFTK